MGAKQSKPSSDPASDTLTASTTTDGSSGGKKSKWGKKSKKGKKSASKTEPAEDTLGSSDKSKETDAAEKKTANKGPQKDVKSSTTTNNHSANVKTSVGASTASSGVDANKSSTTTKPKFPKDATRGASPKRDPKFPNDSTRGASPKRTAAADPKFPKDSQRGTSPKRRGASPKRGTSTKQPPKRAATFPNETKRGNSPKRTSTSPNPRSSTNSATAVAGAVSEEQPKKSQEQQKPQQQRQRRSTATTVQSSTTTARSSNASSITTEEDPATRASTATTVRSSTGSSTVRSSTASTVRSSTATTTPRSTTPTKRATTPTVRNSMPATATGSPSKSPTPTSRSSMPATSTPVKSPTRASSKSPTPAAKHSVRSSTPTRSTTPTRTSMPAVRSSTPTRSTTPTRTSMPAVRNSTPARSTTPTRNSATKPTVGSSMPAAAKSTTPTPTATDGNTKRTSTTTPTPTGKDSKATARTSTASTATTARTSTTSSTGEPSKRESTATVRSSAASLAVKSSAVDGAEATKREDPNTNKTVVAAKTVSKEEKPPKQAEEEPAKVTKTVKAPEPPVALEVVQAVEQAPKKVEAKAAAPVPKTAVEEAPKVEQAPAKSNPVASKIAPAKKRTSTIPTRRGRRSSRTRGNDLLDDMDESGVSKKGRRQSSSFMVDDDGSIVMLSEGMDMSLSSIGGSYGRRRRSSGRSPGAGAEKPSRGGFLSRFMSKKAEPTQQDPVFSFEEEVKRPSQLGIGAKRPGMLSRMMSKRPPSNQPLNNIHPSQLFTLDEDHVSERPRLVAPKKRASSFSVAHSVANSVASSVATVKEKVFSLFNVPSLRDRNSTNYTPMNVKKALKAAPKSKWILEKVKFDGNFDCNTMGTWEDIRGKRIDKGIKKFTGHPEKYAGLVFQNSLRFTSDTSKCVYTLIHREGTSTIKPQDVNPDGRMTLMQYKYRHLAAMPNDTLPLAKQDKWTWDLKWQGRDLHNRDNPPLLPGRGMGVGDTPNLKIIGDIDPADITQGYIGNCWLLSAISALAEFDGAIKRLFRKNKHLDSMPGDKANTYIITLWDLTTWKEKDIVIDESLCGHPDRPGELLGAQITEDGELWVSYLEKAIVVHCGGGWDGIDGGHCTHAWSMLTGCKEQYFIKKNYHTGKYNCSAKYDMFTKEWKKLQNLPRHKDMAGLEPIKWPEVGGGGAMGLEIDQDELFMKMYAWDMEDYIVGASAKDTLEDDVTAGLVKNHCYTVIDAFHNVAGTNIDLFKIRNPWGHGEVEEGLFGDTGPGWDKYPQIKELLNPVVADDGIFYMTKEEFFQFFDHIFLSACSMTQYKED